MIATATRKARQPAIHRTPQQAATVDRCSLLRPLAELERLGYENMVKAASLVAWIDEYRACRHDSRQQQRVVCELALFLVDEPQEYEELADLGSQIAGSAQAQIALEDFFRNCRDAGTLQIEDLGKEWQLDGIPRQAFVRWLPHLLEVWKLLRYSVGNKNGSVETICKHRQQWFRSMAYSGDY